MLVVFLKLGGKGMTNTFTFGLISAVFLTACSTISEPNTGPSGMHARGGLLYGNCLAAAKALDSDYINDDQKKTVYMAPTGPRCDVSAHVLAINKHGILRSVYGDKEETSESLSKVKVGLEAYLRYSKPTKKNVMVFIHGGLVPHRNAVSEAEIMAAWAMRDGYYPIFLVWDSSLNSAYLDYLAFTTDGERNSILADNKLQNDDDGSNDDGIVKRSVLATTRIIGDLGAGVFRAPENYLVQLDNYWERNQNDVSSPYRLNPIDFPDRISKEEASVSVIQQDLTRQLNRTLIFPELDYLRKENLDINKGTSFAAPSEWGYHLLTPVRAVTTGFSEVGRNSWDNMVRRTRLALSSPENLSLSVRTAKSSEARAKAKQAIVLEQDVIDNNDNCNDFAQQSSNSRRGAKGGFTLGMDLVRCVLEQENNSKSATITLAGHSMGAIVANEILWSYPNLNYDKIIYMAAAGTMRDFNRIALPVIRENESKPQFHSLMLHPLSEARERSGKGVPPQGSLLEWIDEMFEGPRNFEEKTLGKYRNISRLVYSYDQSDQDIMSFRVFPVQDNLMSPLCEESHKPTRTLGRCHPLKHGEVNDFTFWRKSYYGDPQE